MNKIYLIYDLSGRQAGYVGMTSRTIEQRLTRHLKDIRNGQTSHKASAIRKLEYQVGVKLLEIVSEGSSWQEAERKWIKTYRDLNWILWNETDGGEGTLGHRQSTEVKEHLSKTTISWIQNHSHNQTGLRRSRQTRKKIAESVSRWHQERRRLKEAV